MNRSRARSDLYGPSPTDGPIAVPSSRELVAPAPVAGGLALYPSDLGNVFAATQSTGSVLDAASATVDFGADFRSIASRQDRWRILGVQIVGTGTNGGPFVAQNWRANVNFDLGQSICARSSGILPMEAMLPHEWAGELTALITNRAGSAATIFVTVWVAPAPRMLG